MIALALLGDPDQPEGSTLNFELALDAPAATDTIVSISLTPPDAGIGPATVLVAAGSMTALFTVTTVDVTTDTSLIVTAISGASSAFVETIVLDSDNQPPIARDDHYGLTRNTPLHVDAASGVIAGQAAANADSDAEDDPLSASVVDAPRHGSVTLNADGSFDYTPSPGFEGQDSFTYRVNDGRQNSNIATVTLSVGGEVTSPSPLARTDGGAVLLEGGTLTLRLALDAPAGPEGLVVDIGIAPSSLGSAPATVFVPAGLASVEFTVLASLVDHDEVMSVTVSYGGQSATFVTEVVDTAHLLVKSGTDGDDTIVGSASADVLLGAAGNDRLDGMAGNDRLVGGEGDDILDGRTGSDLMYGQAGNDTYRVDSPLDQVVELAAGGVDTVEASVAAYYSIIPMTDGRSSVAFSGYVLGRDVENLTLEGSKALDGAGNQGNNRVTGNAARNRLLGDDGNDVLSGGAGKDLLLGGAGKDVLEGGSDSDELLGGAGRDRLFGGAGNDTYEVDDLRDLVREDTVAGVDDGGTDSVRSSVDFTLGSFLEKLTLTGSREIDGTGNALANKLTGNGAANVLTGGAGADILTGGGGADTLDGGEDGDTYIVDNLDTIQDSGTAGSDVAYANSDLTLASTSGIEHLRAKEGTGNFTLTGNELANRLTGNDGNNTLRGLDENDTLSGGLGNDKLEGGLGRDTMTGDAGVDTFIFKAGDSPSTASPSAFDTINDFLTAVDRIDLHTIGGGGLPLAAYVETTTVAGNFGGAASAATAAMADGLHSVVFVAGATDGWLFWNTDANLTTHEQAARLVGLNNVGAFQHGDLM